MITLNATQVYSLRKLLEYNADEERDFMDERDPERRANHIYSHIIVLEKAVAPVKKS